ncbi:type II toxin-antitoxin system HipA family toxin [Bifidobacterium parmae]|uniref:Transcriptional regulator n=1 Tax=Bifidobacterium parmae TaxID=361854 RepID=A0A2N5J389_9BIFI|nr:type II toxin-antitoxin system HipA family toxin [Bifidobacterium parmae]PLS28685.1 transcriptional regulator [Bifidobacterium parmae]
MKPKELLVFVEDQYCGILREDDHGKHSFTYDGTQPNPPQLSLSMPLRSEPWTGKPVEAYIDGVLPDERAIRSRIASLYDDVNANNPFSLLTAIGLDCAGGVQFVLPEHADSFRQDATLKPISEGEIARRLRGIAGTGGRSWQMNDEHWSLNGAQDKIALRFEHGQWFEALGSAATTHIIKPGISGYHEQAFNEYVCMKAIQKLGIPTATTDFRVFDGLPVLVSTRWDRRLIIRADGTTTIARIHQEDFCQATSHMTSEKYQAEGGPGAEEIAACIRDNALGNDSATLFLIALILNFLMAGTDAHAKNYAILEPIGARPTLAPLYDIASMHAYDTQYRQRKLAMKIGGENNYERIELRHWRKLAERTRIVDTGIMELLLTEYALKLPEAFHVAGEETLQLSKTVLGADDETRRNREKLVERIQQGINAQCRHVASWFWPES